MNVNDDGLTYDDWLSEVNEIVGRRHYVSIYDFGAWPSWDCWADSETPEAGAAIWYDEQLAHAPYFEKELRKANRRVGVRVPFLLIQDDQNIAH